jgi:hypothetical protein
VTSRHLVLRTLVIGLLASTARIAAAAPPAPAGVLLWDEPGKDPEVATYARLPMSDGSFWYKTESNVVGQKAQTLIHRAPDGRVLRRIERSDLLFNGALVPRPDGSLWAALAIDGRGPLLARVPRGNGALVTALAAETSNWLQITDIGFGSDGAIFVVGGYEGSARIGKRTLPSGERWQGFVARLDRTGNQLRWLVPLEGATVYTERLELDEAGDVWVLGDTNGAMRVGTRRVEAAPEIPHPYALRLSRGGAIRDLILPPEAAGCIGADLASHGLLRQRLACHAEHGPMTGAIVEYQRDGTVRFERMPADDGSGGCRTHGLYGLAVTPRADAANTYFSDTADHDAWRYSDNIAFCRYRDDRIARLGRLTAGPYLLETNGPVMISKAGLVAHIRIEERRVWNRRGSAWIVLPALPEGDVDIARLRAIGTPMPSICADVASAPEASEKEIRARLNDAFHTCVDKKDNSYYGWKAGTHGHISISSDGSVVEADATEVTEEQRTCVVAALKREPFCPFAGSVSQFSF